MLYKSRRWSKQWLQGKNAIQNLILQGEFVTRSIDKEKQVEKCLVVGVERRQINLAADGSCNSFFALAGDSDYWST